MVDQCPVPREVDPHARAWAGIPVALAGAGPAVLVGPDPRVQVDEGGGDLLDGVDEGGEVSTVQEGLESGGSRRLIRVNDLWGGPDTGPGRSDIPSGPWALGFHASTSRVGPGGETPCAHGISRACLLYVEFGLPDTGQVSELTRFEALTDEQWAVVEPLLPSNEGRKGRPFTNNRRIVNGIIYRYRTGIPWRDLPREQYGPWQTVWKRHRSYARRGVWDHVLSHVISQADTRGEVDWAVSIDATINRAHQHATNTKRPEQDTGGAIELQEISHRGG